MCIFIGIEDLAANALIEVFENDDSRRIISFKELNEYGIKVLENLKREGEKVVLLISKYYKEELFRNYSDYFDLVVNDGGDEAIQLKECKSADDLRTQFRAYLTIELLMALTSIESVLALGINRNQCAKSK